MTTNPDGPVILATLTVPGGEPAGPLLIDGLPPPLQGRPARRSPRAPRRTRTVVLDQVRSPETSSREQRPAIQRSPSLTTGCAP
jgi:hypothetical protein